MKFLLSLLLAALVSADVYMHFPRGSNNRLNEAQRERAQGNRLFDSQNNNRGGVNVPAQVKQADGTYVASRYYFFEGSKVPIQYSPQHGCNNPNLKCTIVLQYACDAYMRDGTTTARINFDIRNSTEDSNLKIDPVYGRHESWQDYRLCRARRRNEGLFIADRRLNGQSAEFTRQNENGDRNGLECPEERDYYPYWYPTQWRDIAILTDDVQRCPAYKAASQNVASRSYCFFSEELLNTTFEQGQTAFIPYEQVKCEQSGGQWVTEPSFNIPAPDCLKPQATRDNHHGNAFDSGTWPTYNWTVPDNLIHDRCVLRIRYNMTSGDLDHISSSGFDTTTSVSAALNGLDASKNSPTPQGGIRVPATIDMNTKYGIAAADVAASKVNSPNVNDRPFRRSRGYIWLGQNTGNADRNKNSIQIDPFGSLIPNSAFTTTTDANTVYFQLALDTSQIARAFEDRSHLFSIRMRPDDLRALGDSVTVHNLGVRGRRGNIVQVYPSVEYDFVPERLDIKQGDVIHIQWAGSNTNPANENGNGPDQFDRSNLIMAAGRVWNEIGQNDTNVYGHHGRNYPMSINYTSSDNFRFLGFDERDAYMLGLAALNNSYFDLGLRQVGVTGTWSFISTRNNDFSNRNQQSQINVVPRPDYKRWSLAANPLNYVASNAYVNGFSGDERYCGVATTVGIQINAKSSTFASNYFQVFPSEIGCMTANEAITETAADGTATTLFQKGDCLPCFPKLVLPFSSQPLFAPAVYMMSNFSANPNSDDAVKVDASISSSGTATVDLRSGGVYFVKNHPRPGAIAAVVICSAIGFFGLVYIYWRIRVQPAGGWKAFFTGSSVPASTKASAPAASSQPPALPPQLPPQPAQGYVANQGYMANRV